MATVSALVANAEERYRINLGGTRAVFEHSAAHGVSQVLFIGRHTAPAVADYVAGPNHILPTGGTARFHSALSLDAYVRKSNIVSYTKDDLFKAKDHILRLAQMEGFDAHAQSVEVRLK